MNTINLKNFYQKYYDKPIVLGLGFFDCVHIGHQMLLEKVIEKSNIYNAEASVLTFSTNPNTANHSNMQIYTFTERAQCMQNIGLKNIIFAQFDEDFKNLSGQEFLDILTSNFNISEIIVGNDFTYGNSAKCTVTELSEYLLHKNIKCTIIDFYKICGVKLSTSTIRPLIENGDFETANKLLSEPYFFISTVRKQNGRGHTFGIPTANMQINCCRTMMAQGVYATSIEIGGKSLKCVTNVGIKPTFEDDEYAIESHILNFEGDLYGEQVKLIFWKKLRDIVKFENIQQLKSQIALDIDARLKMEK